MASPNDKRAVSYDPETGLHLVSKKDIFHEQNSQRWAPEFDDTRIMEMDIPGRIPPAIIPAHAELKFNDKIKKTIPPAQMIYPDQTTLASRPKLLNAAELHQLYAGTLVPAHRYLSSLLSTAVTSQAIALDPAKWLDGISGVNLSKVVEAWLHTNGNTDYEQLNSIGLDANTGWLTGVLTVKQRSGYCGGPSTAGSREFVAIWVDWGSGFQYEGTTSVAVHDYSNLPAAGLEYRVFLPVDVLADAQPGSKGVRRVKARAVLSWNTPPSTTDPCAPVIWGNSLDGLILIPLDINVSSGARSSSKDVPAGSCLRAIS
jgi:hypothetical protein